MKKNIKKTVPLIEYICFVICLCGLVLATNFKKNYTIYFEFLIIACLVILLVRYRKK